ncbi:hypothetical protein SAMN04488066_10868 [Halorubrum aquaticum]|uniref:Uncharacterized protein n=2 Tax=Halorubrum aquaticum TaxID=387340 RepID=A0A1I3AZH8_9EURY|nr:hypothetical protein SAMN04488066_10868 [Halorubrum aquaticum]
MGSLAAGGAATIGTGAFSSATAERAISTQVRTDSNAYLGITGDSDYTTETNGTLEINFDSNGNGTGLNANATTEFTDLLTVTNQGTELVLVWLNLNDLNALIGPDPGTNDGSYATAYLSMQANALANGTGGGMDGGDGTSTGQGTSGAPGQWGVFVPSGESVDIALGFYNIPAGDVGQVYNADIEVNAAAEDSEYFKDVVPEYSFPNNPSRPYVP